jgi:hypothetical protein
MQFFLSLVMPIFPIDFQKSFWLISLNLSSIFCRSWAWNCLLYKRLQNAYDEFHLLVKSEMENKLPAYESSRRNNRRKLRYKPYWNENLSFQCESAFSHLFNTSFLSVFMLPSLFNMANGMQFFLPLAMPIFPIDFQKSCRLISLNLSSIFCRSWAI